ncbi:RNA polymerase II C-terminal domain phosphatase-like 4 [Chenopodium quinoa]|uniref:RNA polymerase II C-terminal domain phosphatase-like 4 n=1 Tax=Chenopodium quinoa TaxID=63459 RepID=UPI000B77A68F|nr:RNA polymerase II C-terminal domain phosphatase-like 4 [Chenopodium quinoa]
MCELVLSIDNIINNNNGEPCQHGAFINNTCAFCKRLKEDCNDPITIPFRYIAPNFSLTINAIRHLRGCNFGTLLDRKKLNLVLDLDHTLIHSIKTKSKEFTLEDKEKIKTCYKDVHEICDGKRLVKLRPGVREFLEEASTMFELSIYTMAKEFYAKEVAKMLRSNVCQKRVKFENVISKEDCTKHRRRKRLDVVLSSERVVLIMDDLEEVWREENHKNLINIKPYKFFKKKSPWVEDLLEDDQELTRVLGVLKTVYNVFYEKEGRNYDGKDVREVLESIKIQSLVEELFDERWFGTINKDYFE